MVVDRRADPPVQEPMNTCSPSAALLALLPLSLVQEGPVPAELRGPATTEIPELVQVPMQEGLQWTVVEVWIEGAGPFPMVLDTGASTTVLNQDLVEELGLESQGISHIGDPRDPLANKVDALDLGEVVLGDAVFLHVAAVGWRTGAIVPLPGVRGVLGLPTFHDCLLTLDYPGRMVEVRPGTLPEPDGLTVLEMPIDAIPTFPITVDGRRFLAHLDAGNASSLVLPASWQDQMPLVDGSLRTGRGMRANGPVEFTSAILDGQVQIGQHVFERPEIRFDEGLTDANVGYELLKGFAVTLDQRNQRVRLVTPPEQAARPVEEKKAGIRRSMGVAMQPGAGRFVVHDVVAGSEGERAGLHSGDEIVQIDGQTPTHDVMVAALEGTGSIRLSVERGAETVVIVLFP
jgi:hypothetical protein